MRQPSREPVHPQRPFSLRAYEALQTRIVRLTLSPGQWVTERALAVELGVGLAPVRSAMARLSNEGLLETIPRRGYRVRSLNAGDADELLCAWRVVAVEVIRLATLNMTPEALIGYNEQTTQGRSDPAGSDGDEVGVLLNIASQQWRYLAQLADNPYLEDIALRLEAQVNRICALGLSVLPDMQTFSINDQRGVVLSQVFARRDADAAIALTEKVIAQIRRDCRRALLCSEATVDDLGARRGMSASPPSLN